MHTRPVEATDFGSELPLLINAAAGSTTTQGTEELTEAFGSAGVRVAVEWTQPRDFNSRLKALVSAGVPAIGIGGGDGTISSAVGVLAGTKTLLVPVPLGTLNHFASRYGMPTVEATVAALTQGSVITIPIGVVNGHTFVNNASCGFYPHVVRYRERMRKYLSKWPAAAVAAIIVFLRRPLLDVEIAIGGESLRRETAAVWIGLGRHSLRLPSPGDADQSGELLEVVLPKPTERAMLFALAVRIWLRLRGGEKASDPEIETLRAPEFRLAARHRIYVAMDGEVNHLEGPLHFEYRQDALSVLTLVVPDED